MITATNPQTGERLEYVDGQWRPLASQRPITATNPQTGQRLQFVNGRWEESHVLRLNEQQRRSAESPVFAAAQGVADLLPFSDEIGSRVNAIGSSVGRGDFGQALNQTGGLLMAPIETMNEAIGWNQLLRSTGLDPTARANRSFAATTTPEELANRNMMRGARQVAIEAQPLAYMGANIGASLVPGLAATRAFRGMQGLNAPGRVGLAASSGAGIGGLYGYGAGEGSARGQSALEGALLGGAFGGGFQAAGAGLNSRSGLGLLGRLGAGAAAGGAVGGGFGAMLDPDDPVSGALSGAGVGALGGLGVVGAKQSLGALQPLGRAIYNAIPTPRPNSLGSFGGNLGRPPERPPNADDPVLRVMAQLAQRADIDPESLVNRLESAQGTGQARVFADILGEAGVRRARTLAELPGRTGDIALNRMRERVRGALDRIERRISGTNTGDSLEALNQQVQLTSQRVLEPWFAQASWSQREAAENALNLLQRRGPVRDALEDADEMISELVEAGLARDTIRNNPMARLHYAKIVLQAQAKDPNLVRNSAARIDNALLVSAADAIADAAERVSPGYRQAMNELQDVIAPREIVRALRGAQRKDTSNVAGNALSQPQVRRLVDRQGYSDLGALLREEDELYGNAIRMMPRTGSQTAGIMLDAMDQISAEQLRPDPRNLIAGALNRVMSPIREGARNRIGAALYEPIDPGLPDYNAARVDELRRGLLQYLRDRERWTRQAGASGVAGGIGATGLSGE